MLITEMVRGPSHKTQHHGKGRVVYLGPHAQEILKPWLRTDLQAYVFSPREGRDWHHAQRAANRKTPKQFRSQPYVRKTKPKRAPGTRYTNQTYCRAIERACELAFGMPIERRRISKQLDAAERARLARLAAEWRNANCWHPNQLRHNAATRIRAAYGDRRGEDSLGSFIGRDLRALRGD